jgi:L-amino acid N-acyltransferase YncA
MARRLIKTDPPAALPLEAKIGYGESPKSRSGPPMQSIAPEQQTEIPPTPAPGEIVVRPSTDADAAAMLAIYTGYVTHGLTAGAEFEPMQADDIKRRRKNMQKHKLPHLVAELDGVVIGYAYAVPFRKRPAYRYCVKHSIYVHARHLRAGAGRKLLPALIDACAVAGYRQMIAYVDSENQASLNLHEACGFRRVAYLEAIGFRFGKWTDSVMLQRPLGAGASEPPPGYAPVSGVGIGDISMESD